MTGPIIFADETARRQLLENEQVATFRREQRTTGSTWFRYSRTGTKQGDATVDEIGPVDVDPDDLRRWRPLSGFETVDDWIDAIAGLNGDVDGGYLYLVRLDGVDQGEA